MAGSFFYMVIWGVGYFLSLWLFTWSWFSGFGLGFVDGRGKGVWRGIYVFLLVLIRGGTELFLFIFFNESLVIRLRFFVREFGKGG